MIRRHQPAPAQAIDRGAGMLLSLRKEFATGNQTVRATNQDHDAQIMDIDKTLGRDIPSGDTESPEVI